MATVAARRAVVLVVCWQILLQCVAWSLVPTPRPAALLHHHRRSKSILSSATTGLGSNNRAARTAPSHRGGGHRRGPGPGPGPGHGPCHALQMIANDNHPPSLNLQCDKGAALSHGSHGHSRGEPLLYSTTQTQSTYEPRTPGPRVVDMAHQGQDEHEDEDGDEELDAWRLSDLRDRRGFSVSRGGVVGSPRSASPSLPLSHTRTPTHIHTHAPARPHT